MNITKLALIATLSLTTAALSAQTSQEINQRKENQQQRIGQGVKSGQLTAGETAHLEKQESAINHEEKNMPRTTDTSPVPTSPSSTSNRIRSPGASTTTSTTPESSSSAGAPSR
jgi:hypothetical protein